MQILYIYILINKILDWSKRKAVIAGSIEKIEEAG